MITENSTKIVVVKLGMKWSYSVLNALYSLYNGTTPFSLIFSLLLKDLSFIFIYLLLFFSLRDIFLTNEQMHRTFF